MSVMVVSMMLLVWSCNKETSWKNISHCFSDFCKVNFWFSVASHCHGLLDFGETCQDAFNFQKKKKMFSLQLSSYFPL